MSTAASAQRMDETYSLPKGWRWARLGDLCRVVSGATPRTHIEEYWNGDIVWITPTDLGSNSDVYISDSQRHISSSGYGSCNTEVLSAGTVVMSSRAPIGHIAISTVPFCTNQGCKSFVPGQNVDLRFLYFLLKWNVPRFRTLGSGATFAEISKTQLERYAVAIPPLSDQQQIARTLLNSSKSIRLARAAAEAEFETAAKIDMAYLRAVFESEDAQQWPTRAINDFAETCSGTTPSRTRPDYYNGDICWVKTGELKDNIITETEEHVTDTAISETSLKLLPAGALLVAMYGQGQTRGRTGLLATIATTNQACFAILPNPTVFEPAFLQLWFCHNYSRLRRETEGRGGNQPNLNGDVLRRQRVPLPPIGDQKRIAAAVAKQRTATERLRNHLTAQLTAIEQLPAALLRQAFNGEL